MAGLLPNTSLPPFESGDALIVFLSLPEGGIELLSLVPPLLELLFVAAKLIY